MAKDSKGNPVVVEKSKQEPSTVEQKPTPIDPTKITEPTVIDGKVVMPPNPSPQDHQKAVALWKGLEKVAKETRKQVQDAVKAAKELAKQNGAKTSLTRIGAAVKAVQEGGTVETLYARANSTYMEAHPDNSKANNKSMSTLNVNIVLEVLEAIGQLTLNSATKVYSFQATKTDTK